MDSEPGLKSLGFDFLFCLVIAASLILSYLLDHHNRVHGVKGCRKLGLTSRSNLADEHDELYSHALLPGNKNIDSSPSWRVKSLWIYPVKSCRGVELGCGTVVSTGMQYDRLFSFATDAKNAEQRFKFVTQRQYSKLALVETEIWLPDPASPDYDLNQPFIKSNGALVVRFPCVEGYRGILSKILIACGRKGLNRSFQIPLNPTSEQIQQNGYEAEKMTIWKDSPECLKIASTDAKTPTPIFEELKRLVGIPNSLALFRVSQQPNREVYRCAPSKAQLGYQSVVHFQDAYPLHLLNLASVHDVAKHVQQDSSSSNPPPRLSARRFRPNILITGPAAFDEDGWKKIRIGASEYFVCCRTMRCRLPNVDPATGIAHKVEPDRTLKSYRRIDPGDRNNACLGMQMVPAAEHCTIKIGDAVEVLETGEHCYVKQ